jgi:tetratricopeptide (TPR) repeat protein
MDEARQHYEEALKIDRQLAEQDPAVYLPDMAMTLSNLGRVDRLENRMEESRANYTEAVTIYRKLAQGDPARYAGDLARAEARLEELEEKVLVQ